jgi:Ca2+-binding RTX toxin-like protein
VTAAGRRIAKHKGEVMLNTLRTLTARMLGTRASGSARSRRFVHGVELLHDRVMPSVDVIGGGHLLILETNLNDTVYVQYYGDSYRVTENGWITDVPIAKVTGDIIFQGFDGDDKFQNFTALRTYADGGNGHDILVGDSGLDEFHGGAGDDFLQGYRGEDYLFGDEGNDVLEGNVSGDGDPSYNYLNGGSGDDILYGGDGVDVILGGDGTDTLWGSGGNDTLVGGSGEDYVYGEAGNDVLYGGSGSDYLSGDDGDDQLDGGQDGSFDELYGGAGRDLFRVETTTVWVGFWKITLTVDQHRDFNPSEDFKYY